MRKLCNGLACLGAAAALLAGGFYLFSGRADLRSALSLDRLLREEQRHQELREELDMLSQVTAAKYALAREVADGRLSLGEAARRFRELDAGLRHFSPEEFRRRFPGRSDDERYRRQVILFAEAELDRQPERAAAVKRRLAAQLDEYLHDDRPAHLQAAVPGSIRPASE
jgi:hypothetical protein